MAAPTSQKADKETYVETLIKRFKAGDPEVVYEKIQSAADLAIDSLDGDTRLSKSSVSSLPGPHWSVEERLRPLNPFYQDKSQKKKFIPDITSNDSNDATPAPSPAELAAIEAKNLRETRAALKSAEKQIALTAVRRSSSEKAFKKHTASMPVSYNGFIATRVVTPPN